MTHSADVLLAAARELRLRRYMGPLPFDVDAWMSKRPECDLPRLETETEYHFEVRDPTYYGGTAFKLRCDQGEPYLVVGNPSVGNYGPHPATLEGWRAVVSEFNQSAPTTALAPRRYIWLHGHVDLVRPVDREYQSMLEEAKRRAGFPVVPRPAPVTPQPSSRAERLRRWLRRRSIDW
ncbi:hypothetical protein [Spirillospora sp. NPDC047279]|uniref:hypothetical protein n=1 Tax=Spirillospora sp. NPDC047279 TaxID=3155478 RepID=UPI0033EEC5E5